MAEQNQTVSTEGELISEKAVLRLMNYIKAEAEGKSYTLPVASDSTLGGVKIGTGIEVSNDGTISVPNSSGSSTTTEIDADKVNIDENTTLADKTIDWDNKVDKVNGKGLSTEDYTTEEKNKLAGLSNYDDTALDNRLVDIEELVPTTATKDNKLATMADIPNGTGGTTNYEDLENKPSIAGIALSGDKTLADLGIQPAEAGKGLSTEDYTTAEKTKLANITTEIDNKVDKVEGKGLSTNDYTTEEKNRLANITIDIDNKVDKIEGKGLSTEDYTTIEKTKLAGLENYDDTALSGRVSDIEEVVPSTATAANKLATIEDVEGIATDYDTLKNKPQIAGVTLSGNKTLSDLGIQASESGKDLSTNDYSNAEKEKVTNATTHISQNVTDTDGVHGLKVDTSGDTDKIYYKNGDDWVEVKTSSTTQLEELPTASADNVDDIYQYIGATTSTLKQGYFYQCVNDGGTYKWLAIQVQAAGGQTIQYDIMPTASVEFENKLIQYTGQTIQDSYQHGYFYECVPHEEEVEGETVTTYTWEQKNVQTGGDSRIGEEITEIKVKWDNGVFRPYISVNPATIIPPFSEIGVDFIKVISDLYYDGDVSLADIKAVWNVGDTIDVPISAMPASYIDGAHNAETVTMAIMGFNHDTLETAISGKSKALITFGMVNLFSWGGGMNGSQTNAGGWGSCNRRAWCNDTCFNALPQEWKNLIKAVTKSSYGSEDTVDKIFLPSTLEVTGSYEGGGSQYQYYINDSSRRIKKIGNTNTQYYGRNTPSNSSTGRCFGGVSSSGDRITDPPYATSAYGQHIMFCI